MGKVGQRIAIGCLVFLCLVVVWEIVATVRYKSYVKDYIESKERLHDASIHYIPRDERMESYKRELELEGNPYSLFR